MTRSLYPAGRAGAVRERMYDTVDGQLERFPQISKKMADEMRQSRARLYTYLRRYIYLNFGDAMDFAVGIFAEEGCLLDLLGPSRCLRKLEADGIRAGTVWSDIGRNTSAEGIRREDITCTHGADGLRRQPHRGGQLSGHCPQDALSQHGTPSHHHRLNRRRKAHRASQCDALCAFCAAAPPCHDTGVTPRRCRRLHKNRGAQKFLPEQFSRMNRKNRRISTGFAEKFMNIAVLETDFAIKIDKVITIGR